MKFHSRIGSEGGSFTESRSCRELIACSLKLLRHCLWHILHATFYLQLTHFPAKLWFIAKRWDGSSIFEPSHLSKWDGSSSPTEIGSDAYGSATAVVEHSVMKKSLRTLEWIRPNRLLSILSIVLIAAPLSQSNQLFMLMIPPIGAWEFWRVDLATEFNQIKDWASLNRLKINTDKTKY